MEGGLGAGQEAGSGGLPAGCCHTGGGPARMTQPPGAAPAVGTESGGAVSAGRSRSVPVDPSQSQSIPVSAGDMHKCGRGAVKEGMLRDRRMGHPLSTASWGITEHLRGRQHQRVPLFPAAFLGDFNPRLVREGDAKSRVMEEDAQGRGLLEGK